MTIMKHYGLLFILITAIKLFTSCSPTTECECIRIGVLNGPSAVSCIQMLDQVQTIEGKKVELIIKNDPLQIQASMLKGKLDFAVLPTVMAANLYNKGIQYRMVACPIWGTLYMLSNVAEIRNINDLNGREIAVFGQGSTADVLTKLLIRNKQLDCTINYRFTSNQETAQALRTGEVQVAVISEPLVSILLAEKKDLHIIDKLNVNGNSFEQTAHEFFTQSAFLVSDRFAKNHPQLLSPVCDAYRKSCNFINEQPQQAASLMVAHGMAPNCDIALQSITLCSINYVASFAIAHELYSYLRLCYHENPASIGGKMPDTGFIFHIQI